MALTPEMPRTHLKIPFWGSDIRKDLMLVRPCAHSLENFFTEAGKTQGRHYRFDPRYQPPGTHNNTASLRIKESALWHDRSPSVPARPRPLSDSLVSTQSYHRPPGPAQAGPRGALGPFLSPRTRCSSWPF